MNRHHISLTEDEVLLVKQIDFRESIPGGEDPHEIYLKNRKPILELLQSLSSRKAIPQQRVAYWTNPELNPGTKLSRRDVFAKNGQKGEEAYIHPHFKKHLRYFLYGADLPQAAIDEFEGQIGNPEWFSGSDILDLVKKTREIVRKHHLKDTRYASEFFKLALDNGLSRHNAISVRKAAVEAARR